MMMSHLLPRIRLRWRRVERMLQLQLYQPASCLVSTSLLAAASMTLVSLVEATDDVSVIAIQSPTMMHAHGI
jgi:hypothetical protein